MLLILFLNNSFKLFYYNSVVKASFFKIDETFFYIDETSLGNEGFIGFFDWLRDDENSIVGIRICYFEDLVYNNILINFPYIKPTFDNKCMEILFVGDRYNFELSGDQDFTNNYVYQSQDNDLIFTFGLDHLTDTELSSLVKNCVVLNKKDLL